MKKFQRFLENAWQPTMLFAIALVIAMGLLLFRIGTLVTPFSIPEYEARQSSQTLQHIIDNPINAPHKLGQFGLQQLGFKGPGAMRSVSAAFGLVSLCLFFMIVRTWFSGHIALIGTLLLASSSWFLHTARLGTPEILLSLGLILVLCGSWLRYSRRSSRVIILAAVIGALCFYIPGFLWFELGFLLWQSRTIVRQLVQTPLAVVALAFFLYVAFLLPLILALVKQPELLRQLAGLPASMPHPEVIGKNLLEVPIQLFARGPHNPVTWLARLPLLDIASAALFILGLFSFLKRYKLDRVKILVLWLIVGSLLVSLGSSVSMTILLPFIYVLITAGFAYLLRQWFSVFPRNPFARNIGISLLGITLILMVFYHTRSYFIAWPNNDETKQAFRQRP